MIIRLQQGEACVDGGCVERDDGPAARAQGGGWHDNTVPQRLPLKQAVTDAAEGSPRAVTECRRTVTVADYGGGFVNVKAFRLQFSCQKRVLV